MPVDVRYRGGSGVDWRTLTDGLRRTGSKYENYSRKGATMVNSAALTLGTLLVTSIELPAGLVVAGCTFESGTQALVQGTTPHLWGVLLDSSRVVQAVTPDDTNPVWAANAEHAFTFGAAFTTTYSGLYYCGVMNANTGGGGTAPSLMCVATQTPIMTLPPIMEGNSSAGQSTPPALLATMGAITAIGGDPWCYVQ